jgi:hypothetical protein
MGDDVVAKLPKAKSQSRRLTDHDAGQDLAASKAFYEAIGCR